MKTMMILLMGQPTEGEGGSPFGMLLPLLLIIVVFYFFMIRPQVKRQKDLRNFRSSLKKGDKVLTTGGIHGKVIEIKENLIVLQVDDNVKLKVDKNAVIKNMADVPQQQK